MLIGVVLVGSKHAYVLFDSSAYHYFTLSTFITMHSITCETLTYGRNTSTGNGIIISNKEYRLCSIAICDREFYANLKVTENSWFDVKLGMELSTFHDIIDYQRRYEVFKIPSHSKFGSIGGSKFLESLESRARAIEGFLTAMEIVESSILVVAGFINVFQRNTDYPQGEL